VSTYSTEFDGSQDFSNTLLGGAPGQVHFILAFGMIDRSGGGYGANCAVWGELSAGQRREPGAAFQDY